jgi:hypothetical protein
MPQGAAYKISLIFQANRERNTSTIIFAKVGIFLEIPEKSRAEKEEQLA